MDGKVQEENKTLWNKAVEGFLSGFPSGLLLLIIGKFMVVTPIVQAVQSAQANMNNSPGGTIYQSIQNTSYVTSPQYTKYFPEPLRSELSRLHRASQDALMVKGAPELLSEFPVRWAGRENLIVSLSDAKRKSFGVKRADDSSKKLSQIED